MRVLQMPRNPCFPMRTWNEYEQKLSLLSNCIDAKKKLEVSIKRLRGEVRVLRVQLEGHLENEAREAGADERAG